MPNTRRRSAKDDGPQVRDRLLEAGTRLFSERGYAATSVGAICEHAGVGKPALYWHFESKEGLLTAVLDSLSSRWIDEVRKRTAQAPDAGQQLTLLLAGMRSLVIDEPQLQRLPTLAALEQGSESGVIRAAVLEIWNKSAEGLVAGFSAATGRTREDVEAVAFVLLGLLSAAAVRYSIDGDVNRLDRSFVAMERAVRAMLAAPREEPS